MPASSPGASNSPGRVLLIFFTLIIGAGLFLPSLGATPVFEVSEGREGVVVNEILQGGSFILPLRNGEIVPSKPILFHWLGTLYAKSAGHYDEFGLRFPSALAALLTLVVIGLTVERILGSFRQGLLAVFLLGTIAGFFQMAQDGRVDMLFTLFVTAAICRFLVDYAASADSGVRSPERVCRRSWIVIAVLLGGAILSKGPLGVVLPLLVIGLVCLCDGKILQLRFLFRSELLLALLVAAPWYFAAAFVGGEGFLGRQLFFENVSRFVGAEGITVKPPLYYLVVLWAEGAPWTIVFGLLLLLFMLPVPRLASLRAPVVSALRSAPERRFLLTSGLIWFVLGVVFFSLAVGKRRAYLLPLFPGLALALTVVLADLADRLREIATALLARIPRLISRMVLCIWIALAVGILGALLLPLTASYVEARGWSDIAVTLRSMRDGFALMGLPSKLLGVVLTLCGLWCVYWGAIKGRARALGISFAWLLLLVLGFIIPFGTTVKGVTHSYRWFAGEVAQRVPAAEGMSFVKTVRDESFDGFFFYFKRHVKMIDPSAVPQAPGLYIARRRWLTAQGEQWRSRIKERFEGGRRIDTPEEKLVVFEFAVESIPTSPPEPEIQAEAPAETASESLSSPAESQSASTGLAST